MTTTIRATACASLAIAAAALAAGSAFAHDVDGEATVDGIGRQAKRAAIAAAIADWKHEVKDEYGYHARWKTAVGKTYECEVERGSKTECEVEATPTR